VVEGRPDHPQGTQPRAGEPRRGHASQQVSLPDDRPGHRPRRGGEVGAALERALPEGTTDPKGEGMKRRHLLGILAAALAACGIVTAAQAQTVAELSADDKPDREQKLLAGAKKEGTLEMYTSAQGDDMGAL